ncbi:hypothetical protein R8Z50_30410 [Longispora sp. K20-0274]|uniref:hypothetical protein n=1 Tax=Longispora sp. K20-0274 TaxID=3088255 RepID=UPI003999AB57
MKTLARIGALVALTAAAVFGATSPASAGPSGCSSVTQIGTTGVAYIDGSPFASVKQFKGCGRNYAYSYVWTSYRNNHSSWEICAAIVVGNRFSDGNCASGRPVEVWSWGADTLTACTHAAGWWEGVTAARSDERC